MYLPGGAFVAVAWQATQHLTCVWRMVASQENLAKYAAQRVIEVEPSCLHWQPLPTTTQRKRP